MGVRPILNIVIIHAVPMNEPTNRLITAETMKGLLT